MSQLDKLNDLIKEKKGLKDEIIENRLYKDIAIINRKINPLKFTVS